MSGDIVTEAEGSNARKRNSSEDIATRLNRALSGYEGFLLGKTEKPGPLTEYALLILGTHVRRYASQEMPRYENVLDGLRDKVDVNWVKDLLYGKYKYVGIGATVGSPIVKVALQLQPQP